MLEYGLFIELRSIIRPKGLTLRASAEALFNAAPGNKPYAVYKAILLYIEKVARVEQQAQISATVINTSMRSHASDTAHWFNFRYDAVDLVLK